MGDIRWFEFIGEFMKAMADWGYIGAGIFGAIAIWLLWKHEISGVITFGVFAIGLLVAGIKESVEVAKKEDKS